MSTRDGSPFASRADRRKRLVALAGLLSLVLVANGVVSLFALEVSNEHHMEDLGTLQKLAAALDAARGAQVHFKKQVQEWKNVLLRGFDPEDLARYRASFENEEREVRTRLKTLEGLAGELRLEVPELERVGRTHQELGVRYRAALQKLGPDPASARAVDREVRGMDRAPTDDMDAIVARIHARADAVAKEVAAASASRHGTLRAVSVCGTAVGVALVLAFLALSFRGTVRE